jgi:hypothetical protein
MYRRNKYHDRSITVTHSEAVELVQTIWTQHIKKFPPPGEDWITRYRVRLTILSFVEGVKTTVDAINEGRVSTADAAYVYANESALGALQREIERHHQQHVSQ